eukprot:symbB.v1.2.014023.t1/scaffold992.1/size262058/9
MIGVKEFSLMKSDAVVINIARGPVVDEVPFWAALQGEKIGGAVLDVWWNDFSWYQNGSWPSTYNFSSLPNVWMTPHVSVNTLEAHNETLDQAAANFMALAKGQALHNVVRNASAELDITLIIPLSLPSAALCILRHDDFVPVDRFPLGWGVLRLLEGRVKDTAGDRPWLVEVVREVVERETQGQLAQIIRILDQPVWDELKLELLHLRRNALRPGEQQAMAAARSLDALLQLVRQTVDRDKNDILAALDEAEESD